MGVSSNRLWIQIALTLIVVMSGLGISCSESVAGPECASTSECEEGLACVKDECREVDCVSSGDCDIHQYCGTGNSCADGCEVDSDCEAGEECGSGGQCAGYTCRETELDCGYGEFCDATTGDCYEDGEPHCAPCNWLQSEVCDGLNPCVIWNLGDADSCVTDADCDDGDQCGDFSMYADASGNSYGFACHRDFCMVECNPNLDEPCPRGFSCTDLYGDGTTNACVAPCDWLEDNDYL